MSFRAKIIGSVALAALLLSSSISLATDDSLSAAFANPPASARPWVIWFWINGNITREGITADLEAMKRVGIGGMMIMEVTRAEPTGPVGFMSADWQDLFKFAVQEAGRLGLEIDMNNAAGWSGSGGPWVTPENGMQEVTASETTVPGGAKFDSILAQPKFDHFYQDIAVLAMPTAVPLAGSTPAAKPTPAPNGKVKPYEPVPGILKKTVSWKSIPGTLTGPVEPFSLAKVIDLTRLMSKDGRLVWDAPEGSWTVIRFGHTFTHSFPQEAPHSGSGPECDKLSKAGTDANFNGMLKKLIEECGPLAGQVLVGGHIDSWEVGSQNWTAQMPEEFRARRGYDLTPYLPALTGRVVESADVTERFLWDFRKTVSELIAENYTGRMQELCRQNGLKFSMECYDTAGDDIDVAAPVDVPVAEFWWPTYTLGPTVKLMSSVAHVNDRPIVGGEAFTSHETERWLAYPGNMKALGDRAMCDGINQFWFHRDTLQPWPQVKPGMEMGLFGVHYDRTQTWWEQTGPYHEYLSRCEYLLRQGKFVADVLFMTRDDPMMRYVPYSRPDKPLLPDKYDYDLIGAETFLKTAQVKDSRIVLPSGMSYRLLVLPDAKTMTVPMLEKIKELVEAGATIMGNPPESTPGLTDYPQADASLKKLAGDLWGAAAVVGKGQVLGRMAVDRALEKIGVAPDFVSDKPLHWIHRRVGEAEVYFVASSATENVATTGTFRVAGKRPELWNAETGKIVELPEYVAEKDSVTVSLRFGPAEAYFVVFRHPVDAATEVVSKPAAALDAAQGLAWQARTYDLRMADGKTKRLEVASLPAPQAIEGPWELHFPSNGGAPEKVTLNKLLSWSDSPDAGVRYFSGTAVYARTVAIPAESLGNGRRLFLDLGDVKVMAMPKLNGKDLGVLWKPPYQVEITDAVKAGDNALEVGVVNLWPNRMIGDEELPPDTERTPIGLATKEWPSWLLEGKTSPTGRFTFASFSLWKKGEPLQPSGLIGPVRILAAESIK